MKKIAIIQVGNNPSSNKYIKNKCKKLEANNINSIVYKFDESISHSEFISTIKEILRTIPNGIIIQQPLPQHLQKNIHLYNNGIYKKRDIDGLGSTNLGLLMQGENEVAPCTALGIYNNLKEKYGEDLKNKRVTIAGRSLLVGKPLSIMLINEGCSVSVFGSNEVDPYKYLSNCDIFVSAIGKPHYWDRSRLVGCGELLYLIDVGINVDENGKIVGDINPNVIDLVDDREVTPVPGGVGQWTTDTLVNKVEK